ncbi:MAG: 5-methylcytosine restriction system specificity protein McrC [Blautia sp.]
MILAIIFAIQIARAYRKGIYRRYRTYESNDSKLKGRIDVARHIRLNPIFNGNIAYSSREYTADNDMNRMILTAYTSLQKRQPGLMRELEKKYTPVKDFISQLKNIMQPASRQEARKLVQKERKKITHAVYSDWESVRKTAILILKYMGIAPEDDGTNVSGILINMNYIWERYLVQIVKEKIENKYQIEGKKLFETFFCPGQKPKKLYPDLVISDKNGPLLIIDAKYKNEWENVASNKSDKTEREREDCFQIMSYMYRAKCKFGGIFCPQTKVQDDGKKSLKEYSIFDAPDEKGNR